MLTLSWYSVPKFLSKFSRIDIESDLWVKGRPNQPNRRGTRSVCQVVSDGRPYPDSALFLIFCKY